MNSLTQADERVHLSPTISSANEGLFIKSNGPTQADEGVIASITLSSGSVCVLHAAGVVSLAAGRERQRSPRQKTGASVKNGQVFAIRVHYPPHACPPFSKSRSFDYYFFFQACTEGFSCIFLKDLLLQT